MAEWPEKLFIITETRKIHKALNVLMGENRPAQTNIFRFMPISEAQRFLLPSRRVLCNYVEAQTPLLPFLPPSSRQSCPWSARRDDGRQRSVLLQPSFRLGQRVAAWSGCQSRVGYRTPSATKAVESFIIVRIFIGSIMNIFVLVSQASLRTKCQDQEPPSNIGRLVVDGNWRQGLALAGWGDHTTHMGHQKFCRI